MGAFLTPDYLIYFRKLSSRAAAPAVETILIFTPAGGIIFYTFTVVAEVIQPLLTPPMHIIGCSLFAVISVLHR